MDYIEELIKINETNHKIINYKKCRTIGHGVYYEWVPILIVYFIMVLFFNMIAILGSTAKEDIPTGLLVMNFISLLMGIIFIPLIIMCLVRNSKQKHYILNGDITIGLIIGCEYSHSTRGGKFYFVTYCYLNKYNKIVIKKSKYYRIELPCGQKIFVAYDSYGSIILSEVLLEREIELIGFEEEQEFSNLTGQLISLKINNFNIYNYKKYMKENNLDSEYVNRFIVKASITDVRIITSHVYRIKTVNYVYYCFIDQNGEKHIGKQIRNIFKPLPEQLCVAYNPQNPKESMLIQLSIQ